MGAIIVDEKVIKAYQNKCSEVLKEVERLEQRWDNLFTAMEEILEESLELSKKYSNPLSPENYQYWTGKAAALIQLKDRYIEICGDEAEE